MFDNWKDPVTGKQYVRGSDHKLRDAVTGKIPTAKKKQSEWTQEQEQQNDKGLYYNEHGESQYEARLRNLRYTGFTFGLDDAITYERYASSVFYWLGRWPKLQERYRCWLRQRTKRKYERGLRAAARDSQRTERSAFERLRG